MAELVGEGSREVKKQGESPGREKKFFKAQEWNFTVHEFYLKRKKLFRAQETAVLRQRTPSPWIWAHLLPKPEWRLGFRPSASH
jgi:hypothetical protein